MVCKTLQRSGKLPLIQGGPSSPRPQVTALDYEGAKCLRGHHWEPNLASVFEVPAATAQQVFISTILRQIAQVSRCSIKKTKEFFNGTSKLDSLYMAVVQTIRKIHITKGSWKMLVKPALNNPTCGDVINPVKFPMQRTVWKILLF